MLLNMTLPLARRSPIHIPRRDLVLDVLEGLVLTVTVVASDRPDAAPLDLAGIGPRVRLLVFRADPGWRCDYGWTRGGVETLWAGYGVNAGDLSGRSVVSVPAQTAMSWGGDLQWAVHLLYSGEVSLLCHGRLQVLAGVGLDAGDLSLTTDDLAPVEDQAGEDVEL